MKKTIVATILLLSLFGCSEKKQTAGENVGATASAAASAITSKQPVKGMPDKIESTTGDLNFGKPNAFCATSRLGKQFKKNGVVYECKGPKPYRWRKVS